MQKVFMMYIIGRSGSGKTTIANTLETELRNAGLQHLQIIDGDIIRMQFGDIFGYSYEERMKCNQVVRVVVQYLINNSVSVVLTQVGAHKEMRHKMKEQFRNNYIEVYVKCSYEECAKRDVKGYYKKQMEGKITNLNGVDGTFDIPTDSDIVIDSEKETVSEAVQKIITYLKEQEYGI